MSTYSIHPGTLIGPVYLTVSDLAQSIHFYSNVIGFQQIRRTEHTVWLGPDEAIPLLVLTENRAAQPKPARTTGLYHFAILTPSRLELSRALRRLLAKNYPLQGASDHLVSEALYLSDLDGNGIELYADRPRDTWCKEDGQLKMATVSLNLEDLLKEEEQITGQESGSWEGLPAQTTIGHIHLQVADIPQAEAFYHDVLGFDLMTRYGPSASFMSAGGYHHHIGLNTWTSAGSPPPPPDTVGLRQFMVQLPDEEVYQALREHLYRARVPFTEEEAGITLHDPSNNRILLAVGSAVNVSASDGLPVLAGEQ